VPSTLVFLETHDGEPTKGALGVLGKAASLGGDVAGVVLGSGIRDAASRAGVFGAATVYVVDDEALAAPLPQPRVDALEAVVRESGAENVLFPASVLAAFDALARHDVVLGPVRDGGYYLIGMRGRHDVLAGVEMSTGDVCAVVAERALGLGVSLGLVESTFDVDEAADLAPLRAVVCRRDDLPHTAAALAAIGGAP